MINKLNLYSTANMKSYDNTSNSPNLLFPEISKNSPKTIF
ncbi:hypothetical protein BN1088_1431731 [Sphingobacterium sp. PM2-P1-29]|nr:hypothetical protein BN1088_1431731 [Sphingobacterium sp. PM2-P1-29]